MIGMFPRCGHWVTLQLAPARDDDEQFVLLELAGAFPGDPMATLVRARVCASPQDAHKLAADRLAAGWAEHSTADRRADAASAAAALRAPRSSPPPAPPDRTLTRDDARAVVAHAIAGEPEPFCLFPNAAAWR